MSTDKLKRKIAKILENKGDMEAALLDVALSSEEELSKINDNLAQRTSEIALEVEAEDIKKVLGEVHLERDASHTRAVIRALNEIRDKQPEKVEPPVVNVDNSAIAKSVDTLHKTAEEIKGILSVKEEFEPVQVYDKNGKPVEWERLLRQTNQATAGMFDLDIERNTEGVAPLSGGGVNGTRDLTSANTWYAVPSTIPSSAYVLVVTQENAVGTIRWAFDNTGTPSSTNGNQAPNELRVKLAPGQVVYYASSTAGDDVNWTTKVI